MKTGPFQLPLIIATSVLLFGVLLAQTPSRDYGPDLIVFTVGVISAMSGLVVGWLRKSNGVRAIFLHPGSAFILVIELIFALSVVLDVLQHRGKP